MYVYLNLPFAAILIVISSEYVTKIYANGGFRTSKTGPKPLWSETTLDKLKKDLLMNYDKYARPEQHYNFTEVRFGLAIVHLETDELKSRVTLHAGLRLVWSDSKLKWNESDYGGISVARIADHEIWQPDIYLYNSVSGGEPITRFGNPNVLIYPNGEVLWVPPAKLTALCKFNLRYWPFDIQHCHFKFGSWTHNGNEIKLELYGNKPYAEIEYSMWSTWNVTNSTAEVISKFYDCCPEPYYHVQFNLTLVRRSGPYKAIIVTPAVVIALLILMQFWLPPQAEEKIILNGFLVVTIVMFLTYFTNQISAAGADTPLIVIFYSSSLYMICFSMVATTAVMSLSKIKSLHYLPWAIRKHLQGKFGKWLLLDYKLSEISANEDLSEHQKAKTKQVSEFGSRSTDSYYMKFTSEKSNAEDWILALVLDRILFIIYSIVLLIVLVLYLV